MTQKQQFKIEGYGLLDYSQKLQEGFLLGYRLNIEDNATVPINFGSFLYAVLEKDSDSIKIVPMNEPEVPQEDKSQEHTVPPAQRGRKPKN